jgi:hypothetical protein
MKLAEDRLAAVNIPFSRFPANLFTDRGKHRWIGMRGINASHLAVVETAKRECLSNVLIMEDDVIFRENFSDLWSRISPTLGTLSYDIFFGYNWWNTRGDMKSLRLARIKETVCTHFWAIQSRFYDTFIATVLANEALDKPACIDGIFTSQIAVMYSPTYNLVGQDEGISLVAEGSRKGVRWHADRHKPQWL